MWLWFQFGVGAKMPPHIDALIREVQTEPLPEQMPGEKGSVENEGVRIVYEVINKGGPAGTVLLVQGLSSTMLEWPPWFYGALAEAGFEVIRYDNRGVGESDWMVERWAQGEKYTLEDMATDGLAILDHLGVEKAHIVGVSMGGMISQRIAISYPERVLSLTSIMSSGYFYDKTLPNVPPLFYLGFVKALMLYGRDLTKDENKLKLHLSIQEILKGKGGYELNHKAILQKSLYEITRRKGYNATARTQHGYAIKKSGSRYAELGSIKAPTLVVHGTDDPLVAFEHALKYAPMIPGAQTLFLEGMGHDLPQAYADRVLEGLLRHLKAAA
ncbi:MAG: alpha/beta hydrolase, partial [Bacteroidetes bacterium]